jgi:hypothetical protein
MRRVPELGVLPGGAPPAPEGFELVFADDDDEHRVGLGEVWSVSLEGCRPVRGFPSFKGQRHHVGRWWTATMDTLVGFESWLERDRL